VLFRVVDARRAVGAFLIFIPAGDPPASGDPPVLAWTILFFFGTDIGVDNFNPFTAHEAIGKLFLACVW